MTWDENSVKRGRRKVNFDPEMGGRIGVLRRYAEGSSILGGSDCQLLCIHGESWEQTNSKAKRKSWS